MSSATHDRETMAQHVAVFSRIIEAALRMMELRADDLGLAKRRTEIEKARKRYCRAINGLEADLARIGADTQTRPIGGEREILEEALELFQTRYGPASAAPMGVRRNERSDR
jgi:hypothetical protein